MYILGISCYYHDSAAALIKDGEVIAAAEEERFSRRKHDASFPKRAIEFCLRKAGISPVDLSNVVFYEKPFLKFERLFLTSLLYSPKSLGFFRESIKKWFFDHMWIKSHIINQLKIPSGKLLFCEHHLSHAASSFFCSPFEKSAVLTVDGVGEWTTASWGIGDGNKISLREEIRFPHSLGLLYSAFTVLAGFMPNEGEYKVMGLAPYGKPKYIDRIYSILNVGKDGGFSVDLDYFAYQYSLRKIYSQKFERLFGSPNTSPESVVRYYADIAASIQYVLEETLVSMAHYVHEKTGLDNLCFAGGVALNGVANWKIANSTPFKNLYIQPAAGDSGGAIGAGLWAYYTVLSNKRKNYIFSNTYLGESENEMQIKDFLDNENIKYRKVKKQELLIEEVTQRLKKGEVIGWVQGEFEWGPRALGHRSILADPRKKSMRDMVNSKIKFREAFRPFAPVVLAEKATEYFVTNNKEKHYPFKFMLYVVPVKKDKQSQLGAVTHVDGTARPQFINKNVNEKYYNLIKSFGKETSVYVLLNTSFNLKGEPIVNTSKEAFDTFKRSGIDTLVLNDYIIEK